MSPVRIRLAPLLLASRRAYRCRGDAAGGGPPRPLRQYRPARAMRGLALKLGLAGVALLALPAVATAANRYSLQGGCYALQSSAGQPIAGGEQIRMQATGLGSYLLYRPDKTYLAAQPDTSLAPAGAPSPAADFKVEQTPGGFTIAPASNPQQVMAVRFAPAQGCAIFPEAELNATGTPAKNPLSYAKVGGLVE